MLPNIEVNQAGHYFFNIKNKNLLEEITLQSSIENLSLI